MKASAVYSEIESVISPWAGVNGFTRGKAFLSWYKPIENRYLTFWFQTDRHGWDVLTGSEFTLEFQIDAAAEAGSSSRDRGSLRRRVGFFLNNEELVDATEIQNDVIASRPKYTGVMTADMQRFVDEETRIINESYTRETDLWFKYWTLEDVRRWSKFIVAVLPRIIDELTKLASRTQEIS